MDSVFQNWGTRRFVGVVAGVESLRARMSEAGRHPVKNDGAGVDGLFESLLSDSFNE